MTKKECYNLENCPPFTITELNKPNMELVAKAFLNLYYSIKYDENNQS